MYCVLARQAEVVAEGVTLINVSFIYRALFTTVYSAMCFYVLSKRYMCSFSFCLA